MAIEPTPENIAKAKKIIAAADASADDDERIAAWLSHEADELWRSAARTRSNVQPYKDWLEGAERPSVTEMVTALEDSLAAARARAAETK